MNIFVTGASGFVGHFLCERLLAQGFSVRGTLQTSENASSLSGGVEPVTVEPLGTDTLWSHALAGVDTIIHLAARVHIMDDPSADPLTEFRKVNVEGTAQLAREAAKAGVKRFVFISSIKVNGEESATAYTTDSPPNPSDPYGISKWEAEQALRKIEAETGLEVVVVRPTLVYGPGVKANFLNMMKIICKRNFGFRILNFGLKGGIPLPFASINNRRSLIYVGNLVDALATCATHPAAAGKTYLVSDGEDVSTTELIRRVAHALEVPVRLLPLPVSWMKCAARILDNFGFWILNLKSNVGFWILNFGLLKNNFKFWILNFELFGSKAGKSIQNPASKIQNCRFTGAVNRLTGSLTVDSSKIRQELGWVPPFTIEEGLGETAAWYREKL